MAGLCALALTAALGQPALASDAGKAAARPEVEARLQAGLGVRTQAEVTALGSGSDEVLVQIAEDKTAAGTLRARAVSALAYAPTARVRAFLEGVLVRRQPSSDATHRLLLRKAAVAMAWHGGPRAVEVIAPLLHHPDREVRLDAAIGLGLTRASSAERPLRSRLEQETDPEVKSQIESQLKLLTAVKPR
jgi:HEAT repeat protein